MNFGDLASRAAVLAGYPDFTDDKNKLTRVSFDSFVQQRYKELLAEIGPVIKRHTFTVVAPTGSVSLTPGSLAADASVTLTPTISGALLGDRITLTAPDAIEGDLTVVATITADATGSVVLTNNEDETTVYAAQTWTYELFRRDYALPSDFAWAKFVRFVLDDSEFSMYPVKPEEMVGLEASDPGTPSAFSTDYLNASNVRKFRLYPCPDADSAGSTVEMDYSIYPADLNGSADEGLLPPMWRDAIARGAAADALMAVGAQNIGGVPVKRTDEAQFHLALWNVAVGKAKIQAKIMQDNPRVRVPNRGRSIPWR